MINKLTVSELTEACKRYRFLKVWHSDGFRVAINTRIAEIAVKRKLYSPEAKTNVIGYSECSFQEYISLKVPFC